MAITLYGTQVASGIVPNNIDDTYATHFEAYGQGGYRTVESIDDRNAIPKDRRALGMLVNVENVGIFKLAVNPNTSNTTDSDWIAFSNVPVISNTASTDGSQVILSEANYTVTTCGKTKEVYNVYLNAEATYSHLRWVLIVGGVSPDVQFLASGINPNSPSKLYYEDKNTFSIYTNTTHEYDFETFDGGITWLASCERFSEYAKTGNPYFEKITRQSLNDTLSWKQLSEAQGTVNTGKVPTFCLTTQKFYDQMVENRTITESNVYFTTDTNQIYKGSSLMSKRYIVVDDASNPPTDEDGNITAVKNVFYVSSNGVVASYIPNSEGDYEWVLFSAGDILDVKDTVMVNGTATGNPVSGIAVRDYVNNDTNKVYSGKFEIKNVTGSDGITRKKAILTLLKVGNVNNVQIDLTDLIDEGSSSDGSEFYCKPILPDDLYYITTYQQALYPFNMFEDPDSFKTSKVALIAEDDEGDVTHTYLHDNYTVYMQDETVQNTFAATDMDGNEYTKDVIFHTAPHDSCNGMTMVYQMIGDTVVATRNSAGRTITGKLIDKMANPNYGLTLSPVGTKGTTESSMYWNLENLVGMSNYLTNAPVTYNSKLIYRDDSHSSGLTEFVNPFLKQSTDQDRADHPDWCFTNTGSQEETSYAEDQDDTKMHYIFDYTWYMAQHNITMPEVVTLAFGNEPGDIDKSMLALEIAVTQIKSANPDCVIGVATPIAPSQTYTGDSEWKNNISQFIEREIYTVKKLQEQFKLVYLIPLYLYVDRNFNFEAESTVDAGTYSDVKKSVVKDGCALTDAGRTEYIAALSAWLMNALPNYTKPSPEPGEDESTDDEEPVESSAATFMAAPQATANATVAKTTSESITPVIRRASSVIKPSK